MITKHNGDAEPYGFRPSCRENQNTHFVVDNIFFFSENHAVYEVMWKKYGRVGQATDDNMAHALGACALQAGYLRLQTHTHNM